MGQFSKVLLAIDNAHTIPQRALDSVPHLGGLNQVMAATTSQHWGVGICDLVG